MQRQRKLLRERFWGKKDCKREGRALEMDAIVQSGCEGACSTGAAAPAGVKRATDGATGGAGGRRV